MLESISIVIVSIALVQAQCKFSYSNIPSCSIKPIIILI